MASGRWSVDEPVEWRILDVADLDDVLTNDVLTNDALGHVIRDTVRDTVRDTTCDPEEPVSRFNNYI